ncbi:cysteine peptidase family C39 domain-containing protein [Myxococcota bacterium]|nr:cysteine peptidase family C39 domain-containing protein [Myxococcota bacterium]
MPSPLAPSLAVLLALLPVVPPDVPYIAQPAGPYCAAAAVLMAGAPAGLDVPLTELLRAVPVHRDGIAWLDLSLALAPLGFEVLVGRLDAADLDALLAAGVPAVVAVRTAGSAGPKHAWVITRHTAEGFAVLDPAAPGTRSVTRARLAKQWLDGETVVVLKRDARRRAGVDWAALEASTRRYVAVEWARRAVAVGQADANALALLDRAVAADATLPELHVARARVLRALGRVSAARAAVATALRLRPGDAEALELAHGLDVPTPPPTERPAAR